MASSQTRVMLWAVPRSVSSAMCRAMMNSGLTNQILFEPYGNSYYLGPERVSDRFTDIPFDTKYSYENAKRMFELPYPEKELVFAKDMPIFLGPGRLTADWIPKGYTHSFIIRHPRKTTESLLKVIEQQTSDIWQTFYPSESGYKEQAEMMHLLEQQRHRIIVLDGDDLLDNPEKLLRAYCQEVGLEFKDSMIHWEPMPEDVFNEIFGPIFEEAWFANMKSASEFISRPRGSNSHSEIYAKFDQKTRDMVEKSIEDNMKYYEEMYAKRLVV